MKGDRFCEVKMQTPYRIPNGLSEKVIYAKDAIPCGEEELNIPALDFIRAFGLAAVGDLYHTGSTCQNIEELVNSGRLCWAEIETNSHKTHVYWLNAWAKKTD
jgi:hypothetical protein